MPRDGIINLEQPVNDLDVQQAKANLEKTIKHLSDEGWHNQFDYKNYGVQYNPIYDKEQGRVKSLEESKLTPKEYVHMANMMRTAPEMSVQWHIDRANKIGNRVFSTLFHYDDDAETNIKRPSREEFVNAYVEAVKKYHLEDENFNYEVIKSIYESVGGKNVAGMRHDWTGTEEVDYD